MMSNDHKGYYRTLGVNPGASDDEIKKHYRKLAKQHHPDRNAGSAEAHQAFIKIQEAYDVLRDPEKRRAYDSGLSTDDLGAGGFGFNTESSGFGFSDIFEQVFGQGFGGWGGKAGKPKDLVLVLEDALSLEDVYRGAEIAVEYLRIGKCVGCNGSGGAASGKCSRCNGRGQFAHGFMTMYCSVCQGTGRQACGKCGGSGQVRERRAAQIKVPAGTEHNARVRVRGEGNFEGGVYGDLVVQVAVKPHQLFEYLGNGNLRLQVVVPFTLALLGGDVSVPCIDGTMHKISIPQGVQQGYELCIRGKGVGHGFMVVKVGFEFPRTTSIASMSLADLGSAEYPQYQQQCKKFVAYSKG